MTHPSATHRTIRRTLTRPALPCRRERRRQAWRLAMAPLAAVLTLQAGTLLADQAAAPEAVAAPEFLGGAMSAPTADAPQASAPVASVPAPTAFSEPPIVRSELRLNFKGAPLDTVLDYFSRAGGFVIVRDAPVTGTIDIVSHHPLSADEAVAMLHTVLNDRGYALIRDDRVLRIVKRDDARTRDLPVSAGHDPADVPRGGEIVTHIVPVRHTSAAKLIDTLRPLLPAQATLTANDDSNALVITDTRTNIRRMMEIIQALDTAVSSILDIAVVPLRYADAVETAEVINKVYETPSTRTSGQAAQAAGRMGTFVARMRGFGGGGDDDAAGDASREARQTSSYVRAVADQRGNAIVVTAPASVLPQIQALAEQLDIPTEAVTAVRVFPLRYADAVELANIIANLYPDPTASTTRTQADRRVGRAAPQPQPTQATTESQRRVTEAKVLAVADTRTNAIIVSASPASMQDIAQVVQRLDATPANVPTVHIHHLKNADVQRTKEILESMFDRLDSSTTTGTTGTRQPTTRTGTGGATGGATTGGARTGTNVRTTPR